MRSLSTRKQMALHTYRRPGLPDVAAESRLKSRNQRSAVISSLLAVDFLFNDLYCQAHVRVTVNKYRETYRMSCSTPVPSLSDRLATTSLGTPRIIRRAFHTMSKLACREADCAAALCSSMEVSGAVLLCVLGSLAKSTTWMAARTTVPMHLSRKYGHRAAAKSTFSSSTSFRKPTPKREISEQGIQVT
jgi:hypothetical protein